MDWGFATGTVLALTALGFAVVSVPHQPLFSLSRLCFIAAASIFVGKAVWWAVSSNQSPTFRYLVAGVIGALSAAGVVGALTWVNGGEAAYQRQSGVPPKLRPGTPQTKGTPSRGQAKTAIVIAHSVTPPQVVNIDTQHPHQKPVFRVGTDHRQATIKLKQADSSMSPLAGAAAVTPASGEDRGAVLNQITRFYILSHDGITPEMAAGLQLPPVDYLNGELEKLHKQWRVRSTDGPNAQTYELPG